jgi:hypothetical protein
LDCKVLAGSSPARGTNIQTMEIKNSDIYTIELTEDHLKLISLACEFTSKFINGDITTIHWPYPALNHKEMSLDSKRFEEWIDRRNQIDEHMKEVKRIGWNLKPTASNGKDYNRESSILFEAHRVFRHELRKNWSEEDQELTKNTKSAHFPNTPGIPLVKCQKKPSSEN